MKTFEAKAESTYRLLMVVAIVGFIVLLTACGGGGDDDEDTGPNASTQPVDCKTRPELCK